MSVGPKHRSRLIGMIVLIAIGYFVYQYFEDKGSEEFKNQCQGQGGIPMLDEQNNRTCYKSK